MYIYSMCIYIYGMRVYIVCVYLYNYIYAVETSSVNILLKCTHAIRRTYLFRYSFQ